MNEIRVGLLGLGTVGSGVVKTIGMQQEKIEARLGKPVNIVKVLVRDKEKDRSVRLAPHLLTNRIEDVFREDVDIVVEVMGGIFPAFDYIYQAFKRGCHVVTANKELLAKKGVELVRLANAHQVHFYYEASVAGGIPLLNVCRTLLKTNEITSVEGILNGTTNYILSQMESSGREFTRVLEEAQALGYAEADPTSDIEGYDALYKMMILSQLIYGEAPAADAIDPQGISSIHTDELEIARKFGFRFKLLGRLYKKEDQVQIAVQPTLLAFDHPLAGIYGVDNAVRMNGNIVGDLLFTGAGAGEFPTASAIIEDIAYLSTQSCTKQPLWSESKAIHRENLLQDSSSAHLSEEDSHFLYLRSEENDHVRLYHIMEALEREQIRIIKADSFQGDRGDTHIGIVVHGCSSSYLERLTNRLELEIRHYPVLGQTKEVESIHSPAEIEKRTVNL